MKHNLFKNINSFFKREGKIIYEISPDVREITILKKRILAIFFVTIYLMFLYAYGVLDFNQSFSMGTESNTAEVQKYLNGDFFKYVPGTTGLISINNTTQEQLEALSGIGEVTAEKIIIYREENGDFTEIDDLLKVSGIGEATLDKIRPYIMVE